MDDAATRARIAALVKQVKRDEDAATQALALADEYLENVERARAEIQTLRDMIMPRPHHAVQE